MAKKKKKVDYLKVIIGLVIICYTVFNYVNEDKLKGNVSEVVKTKETTKKVEVTDTNEFSMYFLDVGQADSILIKVKDKYMLVDAGNEEDGEKLVNYFKSINISKIDYLIATHPHEDHIGGMDNIIDNFEIGNFFMPDVLTTTKTFEDVLNALERNNLSYETPLIDSSYNLGDLEFKVLYVGDSSNDLNDTSIVIKLTYGENTFLLCGDATSNVEKIILDKDLKSTVLKVGHHGSNYSSTKEFINKVDPEYAIISVGKNNSYNHPAKTTIDRLEKNNTKIYRTDLDGTILLTSNKKDISIEKINTDTNG